MPKDTKKDNSAPDDVLLDTLNKSYQRDPSFFTAKNATRETRYQFKLFLSEGDLYYPNGEKYRRIQGQVKEQSNMESNDCRGCILL